MSKQTQLVQSMSDLMALIQTPVEDIGTELGADYVKAAQFYLNSRLRTSAESIRRGAQRLSDVGEMDNDDRLSTGQSIEAAADGLTMLIEAQMRLVEYYRSELLR